MISAYSLGKQCELSDLVDLVAGHRDAQEQFGNHKISKELDKIVAKLYELRHQELTGVRLVPAEEQLVSNGQMIAAIKLIRDRLGCGLKEAKDIAEFWKAQVMEIPKVKVD